MRGIKMLGLRQLMITIIQSKRVEETVFLRHWFWCDVWQNMLANVPLTLAPPMVFIIYAVVGGNDNLNTVQAFTSLSIITLLTTPAANVLGTLPLLASSLSCFDRIQQFMISSTRQDCREDLVPDADQGRTPSSYLGAPQLHQSEESEQTAVRVVNLSLCPSDSAEEVLRSVNLAVPLGSFCIIRGGIGSGKTTLLRAILGEIPYKTGTISTSTREMAYCAQVPWLARGSIKDIICGPDAEANFDEDWYLACLHACMLDDDLRTLHHGDQTVLEDGNTMLSGGQKQRVCMARAAYARAKVVLLDDVFSALDVKTQRGVAERLFGDEGLFKKMQATVILVSHSCQLILTLDPVPPCC
jgi:ATP-binding cassette, subfamily C (CFTR/MRP), member 1